MTKTSGFALSAVDDTQKKVEEELARLESRMAKLEKDVNSMNDNGWNGGQASNKWYENMEKTFDNDVKYYNQVANMQNSFSKKIESASEVAGVKRTTKQKRRDAVYSQNDSGAVRAKSSYTTQKNKKQSGEVMDEMSSKKAKKAAVYNQNDSGAVKAKQTTEAKKKNKISGSEPNGYVTISKEVNEHGIGTAHGRHIDPAEVKENRKNAVYKQTDSGAVKAKQAYTSNNTNNTVKKSQKNSSATPVSTGPVRDNTRTSNTNNTVKSKQSAVTSTSSRARIVNSNINNTVSSNAKRPTTSAVVQKQNNAVYSQNDSGAVAAKQAYTSNAIKQQIARSTVPAALVSKSRAAGGTGGHH